MSKDICGSEDTSSGEPCKFSPGESCPWHDVEEPPETGRPTKLTLERQEKIAQAIEAGKSITSAARMAGVSRNTVFNWLDRGEAEKQADNDNEYTEFLDRITRAKGYGEDFYMNLALELARENGDHRFIASLMKQRFPESWGETETGVSADTVKLEVSERVKRTWPE